MTLCDRVEVGSTSIYDDIAEGRLRTRVEHLRDAEPTSTDLAVVVELVVDNDDPLFATVGNAIVLEVVLV